MDEDDADLTDADDLVGFDLTGWEDELLGTVTLMLGSAAIPFRWDGPAQVVVGTVRADEVEGILDFVAANPDERVADPLDAIDAEWRTAEVDASGMRIRVVVEDFYDGDPARRDSDEYEFGHEWSERSDVLCELTWLKDTGELFVLHAPATDPPEVEVLAIIPTIGEVEQLLEGWEDAILEPDSVGWVRARVRAHTAATPSDTDDETADEADGETDESDADESEDEAGPDDPVETDADSDDLAEVIAGFPGSGIGWTPPAAVGWITSDLDELANAYAVARDGDGPDGALRQALAVLDDSSRQRLAEFFAGEMDVVYGAGTGERTRVELRQALEAAAAGR